MHLLVIGGNGFIGRHFVDLALARGHDVTVVGRSKLPKSDDDRVQYVPGGIGAIVTRPERLERADFVCHLASSAATPSASAAAIQSDIETNLLPTLGLLDAMCRSGNRRFLYVSSGGAVYGPPRQLPIKEDHPLEPLSTYGATKVAFERYLSAFEINQGIELTIIRPSNPYGEQQGPPVGAVNIFVEAALSDKPVTIWGDGSTVRDYVHVSDVVSLMLNACENSVPGVYNCGSGAGTSLNTLLDVIAAETGHTFVRRMGPARTFDPREIVLDVTAAQRAFGWEPRIPLQRGVRRLIEAKL